VCTPPERSAEPEEREEEEECLECLPSAQALTLRTGRRRTPVNSTVGVHGLFSEAKVETNIDGGDWVYDRPMARGHLRSHSARTVPRVRFSSPEMRRTSSLPRSVPSATDISLSILDDFVLKEHSRTSTQPLSKRIQYSRQITSGSFHGAKVSMYGRARDVWWPKAVSIGKEIISWELWKGHMKVVEGHFGTGVVSYFIFLRWLFYINLLACVIWLAFVFIPQVVWRASGEGITAFEDSSLSRLSCLLDPSIHSSHINVTCPFPNRTELVVHESCNTSASNSFEVGVCSVPIGAPVLVSTSSPGQTVFPATDCPLPDNTTLTMCRNVKEDIFPLQYVVDIATGHGIFNTTILFVGQYFNGMINGIYDYPVAFLLTTGVVYLIFIVLIIARMGQSFSDAYTVNILRDKKVDYCNKVFTAWDFNISDRQSARLQRKSIRTNLEETLRDEERRHRKRTNGELAFVVFIRVLTNLFVLAVLAGEGVAIYYSVQASTTLDRVEGLSFDLRALISPVVISVLNYILPIVFQLVAKFEKYKTHSGEIKVTLFRAVLVRLASIIVLVVSLFNRIRCTQPDPREGGQVCTAASAILSNVTGCDETLECWETLIGQEFYTQVIFNFGLTLSAPVVVETAKKLLSLFLNWERVKKYFTIRGVNLGDKVPREFDLPKSILDLIYTQALLWLGMIFSPVIPFIVVVNLFFLFYVKRYSLTLNLALSKDGAYRSARVNFTFLLLLLITLLGCLIPIGFTIAALRPSQECGPFRTNETFYAVIEHRIEQLDNCQSQAVAGYFTSIGFMIPVILLLFMCTLVLGVMVRARGKTRKLLERQLRSESANVSYLMERVLEDNISDQDSVLNTLRRTAYIPAKKTSKARQFKNKVKKKKNRH
jgi:hypothetical protein